MFPKRLLALTLFAALTVMPPWFAFPMRANAQTPISAIFSNDRYAPGPVHDTTWIEAYGGWNAAFATLSATCDSNYNLTNVKVAFTELPGLIRFFDQPQDSAMNDTATYDVYPGTALFTTTWDANAQFVAIRSLSNTNMVAVAVDSMAKDRNFTLTNGGKILNVSQNDSAHTITHEDSDYTISWTEPYVDTSKGFHSLDIGLTISRSYGDSVFGPGSWIAITPQISFHNLGQGDDIHETFASGPGGTYKVNTGIDTTANKFLYAIEKLGAGLNGIGSLGDTTWKTEIVDLQFNSTIFNATNFICPISSNARAKPLDWYYLNDSMAAQSSRLLQPADSAYRSLSSSFGVLFITNQGGSHNVSLLQYDQSSSINYGGIVFCLSSAKNGVQSDTSASLQFQLDGDHYNIVDQDIHGNRLLIISGGPGGLSGANATLLGYTNRYTDANGLNMSVNMDTITLWSGPHTIVGNAVSEGYAKQKPWEPTPLPHVVQLLLPLDSTKLMGKENVQFVWTYSGVPINNYHFHIASSSFGLDSTIADTTAILNLDTGTYSWSVAAENNAGEGPVSNAFMFTIAALAGVQILPEQITGIYPNPFAQSTQITFNSQTAGYADVSIINLLGVEVARLFSGELGAGEHSFMWSNPTGLPDGVYECLVRMNGSVETLPMLMMR